MEAEVAALMEAEALCQGASPGPRGTPFAITLYDGKYGVLQMGRFAVRAAAGPG